jgi:hypothetical protein
VQVRCSGRASRPLTLDGELRGRREQSRGVSSGDSLTAAALPGVLGN